MNTININKMRCYLAVLLALCTLSLSLSSCSFGMMKTETDTEFILDTVCTISASSYTNPKEITREAFSLARKIEKNIDYYDENSTVSRFNKLGANQPFLLDDDTYEILKCALEISEATSGAFDVSIAPVTDLWDFKTDTPTLPAKSDIENALRHVGYEKLILDHETKTLTKTEDNVKINLGGCGKGYVCEKIMDMISEKYKDAYVIVDLGGNTGVCGNNPKHKDGHSLVGVQEPFDTPGKYTKTATLFSGQSAVTSGTYQRCFEIDNTLYHHIIDPKSGYPKDTDVKSVTIISNSSLLADCLSTACMVLSESEGDKLAAKYGAEIIRI